MKQWRTNAECELKTIARALAEIDLSPLSPEDELACQVSEDGNALRLHWYNFVWRTHVGTTWFGDVRFHNLPEHVQPLSLELAGTKERSRVAERFALDSDDVVVKMVAWREEDDASSAGWLGTDEHDVFVIVAKQVANGVYRRSILDKPVEPDFVWRVGNWSRTKSRGVLVNKIELDFDSSVADVDDFVVGEYVRVVLGENGEVVRVSPAFFEGPPSLG